MKSWQIDLLMLADGLQCEQAVFGKLKAAAADLGFEYCAYGLRTPWPVCKPATFMLNNYPSAWQERYVRNGYMEVDPTVLHAQRSEEPLTWRREVFADSPSFWEEAQAAGLRHGWAQSYLQGSCGGMLTLSRSATPLSDAELIDKEHALRMLVVVAHMRLSKILLPQHFRRKCAPLTSREIEVLKWTASGKTTGEISDLLAVSENTVKFHIRNVIGKLNVTNKTAAAVYAAMSGILR